MRAVPRPDPVPRPPNPALMRFRQVMRWTAVASIAIAVLAMGLVAWGTKGFHIHMLIATALGAGLSVLLAGALMSLIFLSSSSGHDDRASGNRERDHQ